MGKDEAWLSDMLDAARDAVAHSAGSDRDSFKLDRKTQHAVELAIVIIGEAAGQVTPETRAKLPSVQFADIVRMRNRLVHHYFKVDLDLVWDVVENDLGMLIASLESHLATDQPDTT